MDLIIYSIIGGLWWLFFYYLGMVHACVANARRQGLSETNVVLGLVCTVVVALAAWPVLLVTFVVRGPPKWE